MENKIDIFNVVIAIILPIPTSQNKEIVIYFGKEDFHDAYFRRLLEIVPEICPGIGYSDLPQYYAERISREGYVVYWNEDIVKREEGPSECFFYLPASLTSEQAERTEMWREKLMNNNTNILSCQWNENGMEDVSTDMFQQLLEDAKNQKNR